jgi:hypothetical protein
MIRMLIVGYVFAIRSERPVKANQQMRNGARGYAT